MAQTTTSASTWREFDKWMGSKDRRKVANNTYAERRPYNESPFDIAIRLHNTDILTFHEDGTVTLNSGGWRTVTTKDRMNAILWPVCVFSRDGVWSVTMRGDWTHPVSAFYDGMVMTTDGAMVSDVMVDDGAELKRQKAAIRKYVKLYTDDKVAELVAEAETGRGSGDCLFCQFRTENGTALGDVSQSNDHLESHVEEGYVMVNLMVNALKWVGYADWQVPVNIRHASTVRRAVRRYLAENMTNGNGSHPARGDR